MIFEFDHQLGKTSAFWIFGPSPLGHHNVSRCRGQTENLRHHPPSVNAEHRPWIRRTVYLEMNTASPNRESVSVTSSGFWLQRLSWPRVPLALYPGLRALRPQQGARNIQSPAVNAEH
jgi:hypothetical protein